jgi:hypothetical protein
MKPSSFVLLYFRVFVIGFLMIFLQQATGNKRLATCNVLMFNDEVPL